MNPNPFQNSQLQQDQFNQFENLMNFNIRQTPFNGQSRFRSHSLPTLSDQGEPFNNTGYFTTPMLQMDFRRQGSTLQSDPFKSSAKIDQIPPPFGIDPPQSSFSSQFFQMDLNNPGLDENPSSLDSPNF